ncbi:MAG TPA: sulfite reductase subunit alpha [Oxalicibacterium sp.]|nr:sulfite reductase subunit alpha [Oxalicibacterium sp.]
MTTSRLVAALLLVVVYLAMCAAIYLTQRRKRRSAASDAAALWPGSGDTTAWLIGYASQTGFAEQLAWQAARALHTGGVMARVLSLSEIDGEMLARSERALFITSTYGEGDPPDNASLFADRLMQSATTLPSLHYGLLMLGDDSYARFCGFGRALHAWLQTSGAQALFDPVVVSNEDPAALQAWQHHVHRIAGTSDVPDWQAPAYRPWRLAARRHLNPHSAGAPTFHIELEAPDGETAEWQAGDLVQILAPGDRERPREYSVASIPADGRIHLLVRQERHDDGTLGVASGWLTQHAPLGAPVDLRLRAHANFRIGGNTQRPLILIGNGTGLAGLRSHLKARTLDTAGAIPRNWLIFGERNAAHDFYHRGEIEQWQAQGVLARVDTAFSRDQNTRLYVQDRLRERAELIREWIAQDAAVYVCGSLDGMAAGVEKALKEMLGEAEVAKLIEQGRYRRDVY